MIIRLVLNVTLLLAHFQSLERLPFYNYVSIMRINAVTFFSLLFILQSYISSSEVYLSPGKEMRQDYATVRNEDIHIVLIEVV